MSDLNPLYASFDDKTVLIRGRAYDLDEILELLEDVEMTDESANSSTLETNDLVRVLGEYEILMATGPNLFNRGANFEWFRQQLGRRN